MTAGVSYDSVYFHNNNIWKSPSCMKPQKRKKEKRPMLRIYKTYRERKESNSAIPKVFHMPILKWRVPQMSKVGSRETERERDLDARLG